MIDSGDEVLAIAPSLPRRLDWLMSDTDRARAQRMSASPRCSATWSPLAGAAEGRVGADEPLLAFEDAIREFALDHVLIGLRPAERTQWQERGLLDGIQERFGLPMTVFQLADA